MYAYDYPMLGVFWSLLLVFLWIAWLMALFNMLVDIFRDDELSGLAKGFWLLFVLVLPFLGLFVYLVVRGPGMGRRRAEQARASQEAVEDYIRRTAGTARSVADEIDKLDDLRRRGALTDAEFERQKAMVLASGA